MIVDAETIAGLLIGDAPLGEDRAWFLLDALASAPDDALTFLAGQVERHTSSGLAPGPRHVVETLDVQRGTGVTLRALPDGSRSTGREQPVAVGLRSIAARLVRMGSWADLRETRRKSCAAARSSGTRCRLPGWSSPLA
ncbi:MAG: hypothetical protein ACRDRZ_14155 [Pseudonocardiaceae bacterium]